MRKDKQNQIFIPEDPAGGPSFLACAIVFFVAPPFSTMIAIYMLFKRGKKEWKRKRYRDYRSYANVIGNRYSVSIRELASRLGKATADVVSDLQSMIDQGFIRNSAYIDRSSMMLVLDPSIVETEFVNSTKNIYVEPEEEPQVKARPVAQPAAAKVTPKATPEPVKVVRPVQPTTRGTSNDDFEDKLREIQHLNDEIADGPVSDRIDRIGELTASIFRVVREKPERSEEVRKFMNYYLPTTFKLLKSYGLMEKQSYQGENIQASRRKIEDILDTLIRAFEQQQDRLFRTEAMDVDADISVLETMMASDGLIESSGNMRMRASAGK